MKKKNTIRAIVSTVIIFELFNLVAFAIPFAHTAAFWVSYGVTFPALGIMAATIYIAFIKNPDAKSRFYNFPIARIGITYGIAQLIASLVVMTFAKWIPGWIPACVYAIGFGVAALGLIGTDAVIDEIQAQDTTLKKDVSLMRTLQSKVSQIAVQSEDPALTALAEEFRFSDPVSSETIHDVETDLSAAVAELQAAFVDGDKEAITQLCRKTTSLLTERNRLCKLNKQ